MRAGLLLLFLVPMVEWFWDTFERLLDFFFVFFVEIVSM